MFLKLLLCWAREQSNQFSLLSFTWQNSTAHTKTRLLSGYDNCWCQMFVVLFLKNGLLGASLVLCSSLCGNYRRRTQKMLKLLQYHRNSLTCCQRKKTAFKWQEVKQLLRNVNGNSKYAITLKYFLACDTTVFSCLWPFFFSTQKTKRRDND